MTRRTLHQRPGVTMAEVLIAMFTMAIGMICLMTLFPLGALQVGQALRDDRCRQTGLQADAYMRAYWRHQVVDPIAVGNLPTEPFFWTMDDVNLYDAPSAVGKPKQFATGQIFLNKFVQFRLPSSATIPSNAPGPVSATMLTGDTWYNWNTTPPQTPDPASITPLPAAYATFGGPNANPSYPVFIDPLGEINRGTSIDKFWVAGSQFSAVPNFLLLPRRQLNVVGTSQALALQLAGMTDDMSFETNGAPSGGAILGRQGRYTWSAIIQRPRNDIRNIASLTILVYDGRPLLPQAGDEIVINPDAASPIGSRTLQITIPDRGIDQPVLLRKGGWIMDGTVTTAPGMVNFYRISGFVEVSTSAGMTSYDVDLETPLKSPIATSSQLYLFAGLAEVFERPALRPDTNY